MRAIAERHGVSLAKLLQEMVLVYEGRWPEGMRWGRV
jgi:hypothetical protein